MYNIRHLSAGYQNFGLFFCIFWGIFFDFNGNDAFALIFSVFGDGEYRNMGQCFDSSVQGFIYLGGGAKFFGAAFKCYFVIFEQV